MCKSSHADSITQLFKNRTQFIFPEGIRLRNQFFRTNPTGDWCFQWSDDVFINWQRETVTGISSPHQAHPPLYLYAQEIV